MKPVLKRLKNSDVERLEEVSCICRKLIRPNTVRPTKIEEIAGEIRVVAVKN